MLPTIDQLIEALWQAYHHGELDTFGAAIISGIDGNDDPELRKAAKKLHRRLLDVSAA